MKLTVEQISNGYILWGPGHYDGDDLVDAEVEVIEERGTDREALVALFQRLADWFGFQEEKYGAENLRISWDRKGCKHDDYDETKDNQGYWVLF